MKDVLVIYLCASAMVAMVLVPILFISDDEIRFAILKKILCRLGFHKMNIGKIRKYYCQYCKKPRNHPKLKNIDGGKKMRDNKYKF
jgi:hypothetical protein